MPEQSILAIDPATATIPEIRAWLLQQVTTLDRLATAEIRFIAPHVEFDASTSPLGRTAAVPTQAVAWWWRLHRALVLHEAPAGVEERVLAAVDGRGAGAISGKVTNRRLVPARAVARSVPTLSRIINLTEACVRQLQVSDELGTEAVWLRVAEEEGCRAAFDLILRIQSDLQFAAEGIKGIDKAARTSRSKRPPGACCPSGWLLAARKLANVHFYAKCLRRVLPYVDELDEEAIAREDRWSIRVALTLDRLVSLIGNSSLKTKSEGNAVDYYAHRFFRKKTDLASKLVAIREALDPPAEVLRTHLNDDAAHTILSKWQPAYWVVQSIAKYAPAMRQLTAQQIWEAASVPNAPIRFRRAPGKKRELEYDVMTIPLAPQFKAYRKPLVVAKRSHFVAVPRPGSRREQKSS